MLLASLVSVAMVPAVLVAAPAASTDAQSSQELLRLLEVQAAKGFLALSDVAFGLGVVVNDQPDAQMAASLKPTLTVPLEVLGIRMAETGPGVKSKNLLAAIAYIDCDERKRCQTHLTVAFSREVELSGIAESTFKARVWEKVHQGSASDVPESRAMLREWLTNDVNEFVKYWTIANQLTAK